jgi:uncharacterized membrane protein
MDLINNLVNELKDKMTSSMPAGALSQNIGTNERIFSVIGGSLMTIYGIKNASSPIGAAVGLIGGALLFRGTTGFCPVNDAIGRNTSEPVSEPQVIDLP